MKKIIKITVLILITGLLVYKSGIILPFQTATVRAFGDLLVDFHVPAGTPLFNSLNIKPGDQQNKDVDVKNSNSYARLASVKGVRISGIGDDPKLETALNIIIKDGSTIIYGLGSPTGNKKVSDFFTDSITSNGINLGNVNPNDQKTYNFQVIFPSSSGNEYQAKSVVFDLTFGTIDSENIVINEVYYLVGNKNEHDSDSPKDRGYLKTKNYINDECEKEVKGKEKERGKEKDKRKRDEREKDDRESCKERFGQNDEWVEIYNPTSKEISLKDWSLTDNSNNPTKIHANKKIKPHGFVLITKSESTWKDWKEGKNALNIELGSQIGDGLDNLGDHLILKDNKGVEVDRMSWGTDTSGFTPAGTNPVVSPGSSTERINTGFDTDKASDWTVRKPPTPGK